MIWDTAEKAMERLREMGKDVGQERTRRSLAQLALAVFALMYIFLSLMIDPAWRPAFITLGFCYLVGFFAIGSEWFWGRWFAMGLGWSGFMVGMFSLVNVGPVAPLIIYTLLHGAIAFSLKGQKVAALYEGQTAWRERYGLDEFGVTRVGKAVTRTSASLPALVVWALGPKDPQSLGMFGATAGAVVGVAFALAAIALVLLLKMRSAGVLVVAGAAAVAIVAIMSEGMFSLTALQTHEAAIVAGGKLVATAALVTATLPFGRPLLSFLRSRR